MVVPFTRVQSIGSMCSDDALLDLPDFAILCFEFFPRLLTAVVKALFVYDDPFMPISS
jgi:hypothetical protein